MRALLARWADCQDPGPATGARREVVMTYPAVAWSLAAQTVAASIGRTFGSSPALGLVKAVDLWPIPVSARISFNSPGAGPSSG